MSSWPHLDSPRPAVISQVNPAATFLQRLGHDWQEPQETGDDCLVVN